MTTATLHTRARLGIEAPPVTVEVHLSNGLPALSIVGLPEAAVRESKDRVRSALLNSGLEFPARRITVNLAPADLPKEGGRFDLPIALGILAASGQLPIAALEGMEYLGELALTGALRPVAGLLPAAIACARAGRSLLAPAGNATEAGLCRGLELRVADHLLQVCGHLHGSAPLPPHVAEAPRARAAAAPDLAEVRGQERARRALEVAAAGGHNLLMVGPPGSGKTMLASRLPGILPPLTEEEALELSAIRSLTGHGLDLSDWGRRPFRCPHHTASAVALVGGGSHPRPGEISLAHHGVLFLDELPEYDRRVLEVLREPLETGRVCISRAHSQVEYPAAFQLVAAMNPCPCGHLGEDRCRCTPDQVRRYRSRLSGPLLDRIDLHLEVPAVPHRELMGQAAPGESSAQVRRRVMAARARQLHRAGRANARLDAAAVARYCRLDQECQALLCSAAERLHLSARATHRVLKVARTIADLEESDRIAPPHLAEALGYRSLDRDSEG